MEPLFQEPKNIFKWKDVKTFFLRNQYNELLNFVIEEYYQNQYKDLIKYTPPFLNVNNCLTLKKLDEKNCRCGSSNGLQIFANGNSVNPQRDKVEGAKTEVAVATFNLNSAKTSINNAIENFIGKINISPAPALQDTREKIKKIEEQNLEESKRLEEYKNLAKSDNGPEFKELLKEFTSLEAAEKLLGEKKHELNKAEFDFNKPIRDAQTEITKLRNAVAAARVRFESDRSLLNEREWRLAEENYNKAVAEKSINAVHYDGCDKERVEFCAPNFAYDRLSSLPPGQTIDLTFNTEGLTVGAVVWMYYYERMGIFKILGALMDDYNYRGKYTISGSRKNSNGDPSTYSILMDMICTLHRIGISSNLRDRICTYQRVIGVSIENKLGIESEQNTGFMKTFNRLIGYMLEYYKAKQLAQAIQSQSGTTQPRSSVATQTSIRDTMNVLKQQFEPLQYGRNQINTFIGIATIHATLCLLNMVKTEIGIPAQYERPEEFIPAAYDILVVNRKPAQSESNRFIVYDNCASYGYRLLTDIETADLDQLNTIAVGSTLDTWLNDVEGLVEGYNNAYKSVEEKASAMV